MKNRSLRMIFSLSYFFIFAITSVPKAHASQQAYLKASNILAGKKGAINIAGDPSEDPDFGDMSDPSGSSSSGLDLPPSAPPSDASMPMETPSIPPPSQEPAQISEAPPEAPIPPPAIAPVEMPTVQQPPPIEPPMQTERSQNNGVAEVAQAQLKNLSFKANAKGGTIIIETNKMVTYSAKPDEENKKFVLELDNVKLPKKWKNPLKKHRFKGAVASVDVNHKKGAKITQITFKLKSGYPMPMVEQESQSIMVIMQDKEGGSSGESSATLADNSPAEHQEDISVPENDDKILPVKRVDEYLAQNNKFYGKKISLEVTEMDIREVIKMVTEETGMNLVLDEQIKGNVTLKLRQVPWDQALVILLKLKQLGYSRNGNVLRIATLVELKREEDEVLKAIVVKPEPPEELKVRIIQVNYAKIEDMVKNITPFLTPRGKIIADARTSSIVLTDTQEGVDKAIKLSQSLDIPPYQVLIEGKIVEARERFMKTLGVNWSASGKAMNISGKGANAVNMTPSMSGVPTQLGGGALNLNLSIGTLDIFGDLSATLALNELQENVKVISSPRIVTMHNEAADINQTTQIPLISSNNQNGVITSSVSFKPLQLSLKVTPQVTADGGVIMSVDVNRDYAGPIIDLQTQAASINSRSAKTKVLVKNGQTAVIGGIYQSDATDSEVGIPWLRQIPVVGALFKTNASTKDKIELLIFLTPQILGQLDSHARGGDGKGAPGDVQ